MNDRPHAGKVAVVTGGSRGIGKAIATMFAEQGAAVAVNYLRREEFANETAEQLRAAGAEVITVKADVREKDAVAALVAATREAFGGVDYVISNAASGSNKPGLALTTKGWDWALDTNARPLLYLAQEAVASMRERGGGRFVALSSLGSSRVVADYTSVGVSKAALETLTRYLGIELAGENITVNCVSASVVETDALRAFEGGKKLLEDGLARNPTGRMVTPQDVAGVVSFLCSPEAAMIVGQTIIVDGGYSLPI